MLTVLSNADLICCIEAFSPLFPKAAVPASLPHNHHEKRSPIGVLSIIKNVLKRRSWDIKIDPIFDRLLY